MGNTNCVTYCRATNIAPKYVLACHNESAYNPLVPRRIGLICLEPAAEGGESLIVTNEALTECGPPELFEFVRKHGGVKYQRNFPDKFSDEPQVCVLSSALLTIRRIFRTGCAELHPKIPELFHFRCLAARLWPTIHVLPLFTSYTET